METAGLVIAAFPLVVRGLQGWMKGAETIKHWRRFHRDLSRYVLRLKSQEVVYLDTIEQLLSGIVHSHEDLVDMLATPGTNLWHSTEYYLELRRRLDRSYEPFMDTLVEMNSSLNDIREKFGICKDGKVSLGTLLMVMNGDSSDFRSNGTTIRLSKNFTGRHEE